MTFPVSPGYGGRQAAVFQQRAVNDGGVYYPNSIPSVVDHLQRFGIYGDASLVMIPAAVKAAVLYSLKPTNGDGDFTVTRNSVACRVNEDLKLENVAVNIARLDYTDGVPVVLLEPQRTNLITHPVSFDNAYWTKSGTTIDDNGGDGYSSPSADYPTDAFKLVEDDQDVQHTIYRAIGAAAGAGTYTQSIYVKAGERRYASLITSDAAAWISHVTLDLQTGLVTKEYFGGGWVGSYEIIPMADGWYRFSVTITGTYDTTWYFRITIDNTAVPATAPGNTYQGDGVSGVYIYGAQLEEGSYPTSLTYAGTEGSTVTRITDAVNEAGQASTFNSVEGVLYAEIAALADDETERSISLSDGSNANRVKLSYSTITNQIEAIIDVGSATQATLTYTLPDETNFAKVAVKWKEDDFALWVNGVERDTDVSGSSFAADVLTELAFDEGDGTNPWYGKYKQGGVLRFLSDNELEDLTTP